ncbi:TRAP-type C4-dicarboxylate transport system, small permease component [Bhargavaea ginsengi]|uniref:TRAP-type C4-dicarboxylate transport system, small permease component n=1 Tax=Bhargavaea ginsengi TaxID=426757 RepID=A0A1H6UAC0_9BACL|nr:TRAP transporter small permease [Bhargavaea ginsengi]SEI89338.1 TRAP-type C4-dicarboxylate transport system, small permease component [Bhargavaea ginsengi]
MELLQKPVRLLTNINKWIGLIALGLMFPAVFVFAVARTTGNPIIGDIELVQFVMVVLIMGSLSLSEATNTHISIGLFVDKFSPAMQRVMDFIAHLLTLAFCLLVCWAFLSHLKTQESDLLGISYVPFKLFVIFGFLTWGLEALLKLVQDLKGEKTVAD